MIETEITSIERVEREHVGERDERIEIHREDGWTFAGILERNCYREDAPDGSTRTRSHYLEPGRRVRFWGGLGRPVHQVEAILRDDEEAPDYVWAWDTIGNRAERVVVVWDTTNDFRTLEEDDEAGRAYVAFTEDEGARIAERIDAGTSPEEIEAAMADGHTGNTAAWAWRIGTEAAKDEAAAQRARDYWNGKHAPGQEVAPGGLVNPAVLVLSASDEQTVTHGEEAGG